MLKEKIIDVDERAMRILAGWARKATDHRREAKRAEEVVGDIVCALVPGVPPNRITFDLDRMVVYIHEEVAEDPSIV